MRKSSSSAVGYKLSSTTVSFRGGTDSRPHQKRKKVAIGGYDKKMKRTLFFVSKFASYHLVINIYPIFPMIPSTLVRDRYRKHVSTWLNIFFYHENVCVCVCMCVTISSYDHPILHFSPFISMYDMI